MSYRTGPGVPRTLTELWQFVRREFMSLERLYTRVEKEAGDAQGTANEADDKAVTAQQAAESAQSSADSALASASSAASAASTAQQAASDAQDAADAAALTAEWVGVTGPGRPEDNATVGATVAERILIESSTGVFLESFTDADALENWEQASGSGNYAVVAASGTATIGGRNVYIGDYTANDEYWLASRLWIPFDSDKLYRIEARVLQYSASDAGTALYIGVQGRSWDGLLVAKDGDNKNGNAHYAAADGVQAGGDGWQTYVGYVRGHGSSAGTDGTRSISDPAQMHPDTRFIRPLFITNYPDKSGKVAIDYIRIDVIQVRDQRDLPMLQSSAQSGTASSALTAEDGGSTATINIAPHTVQYGFGTISYNSGSITGKLFSRTYYVFCDDPDFEGGAVTYDAGTDPLKPLKSTYRRYLGKVTTPSNGGGSTGGSLPGTECLVSGSWLRHDLRVDDLRAGDVIDCWDDGHDALFQRPAQVVERIEGVDCVMLTTESGAQKPVSMETPLTMRDGRSVLAQHAIGGHVAVQHDGQPLAWELITDVQPLGEQTVYRISVGGISYAGGVDPAHRIVTHNAYKP